MDCQCNICKGYCNRRPGWMKPGEAERIAEFLGLSLQELFNQKLAVDWWVDTPDVFVLLPNIEDHDPGTEMPGDPRGRCVFFKDGLCEIHEVKPFECCMVYHTDVDPDWHEQAADAWRPDECQAQIAELLGREPESAWFPDFWGLLSMF